MRILALADVESKYLWDYFEKEKLENIDLILSCGDLSADYLSFLATFAKVPILYVHGNHDGGYEEKPPEGCICIDDDIFVYKGVRILGLGGSAWYNNGPYQYTDKDMNARIFNIKRKIWRRKGFDILLTHSPAFGINDGEDNAHKGFQGFTKLLDKYSPKLFVHGHVHTNYSRRYKRLDDYNGTTVVNAYERYIIEYDENKEEDTKIAGVNE